MTPIRYQDGIARANEVVDLVITSRWPELLEISTDSMASLLAAEGPRVWRRATRRAGAFGGIEARLFSAVDDDVFQGDYTLRFEKRAVRLRLALDAEGRVSGLILRPGDWG